MAKCQKCGDAGVLVKPGSEVLAECQCALIRRIAASMPPHIRRANAVRAHFDLPIIRNPFRSVYMVASWADVKAMVKAVVMLNPMAFVKITSDREILDVFLGKKAKGARDLGVRRPRNSAELDDVDASYSSIEDLMDSPRLVVVRLNEIGYKNKSASGCLEEAVAFRVDRDKPVWVVSDVLKPFVQGSPAWSESVWDYLQTTIPHVSIPRIAPIAAVELTEAGPRFVHQEPPPEAAVTAGSSARTRMESAAVAADLAPEPAAPPERPRRAPRRAPEPDPDMPAGPAGYGQGLGYQGGKGRFRKD